MKQLISTSEGTWIEPLPVQLTAEQVVLLLSQNPEVSQSKQTLMQQIKAQSETTAQPVDKALAQYKYNELKPSLGANDTYQLIEASFSISDIVESGIINCRINGEHKQIRF